MMPISVLSVGEESVIKRIGGSPEVRQHLEDLGFVVGVCCAGCAGGAPGAGVFEFQDTLRLTLYVRWAACALSKAEGAGQG